MAPSSPNTPNLDSQAGHATTATGRTQRVLACVNCQQRKIKCDRRFPCANCLKHNTECQQASQTRPRKRRFAERELLGRLRRYEELLRQNEIQFDPLHGQQNLDDATVEGDKESDRQDESNTASPSSSARGEIANEPKSLWRVMSLGLRHPKAGQPARSEFREAVVKWSWDQTFQRDDHIILGSRKTSVDLAAMHPEPLHIFRHWQLYLENVNPLLKVIHTPTLQGKIIEAASNTASIEPHLEALMFGIYCMSTQSLTAESCQSIFGFPKSDLLEKYQFACQQALLNCQFLRSDNRECFTALCLFLFSLQSNTNPRSLSSMLGLAIQIAQRMGIHSEFFLAQCSIYEAELRRRLWWALVLFDARIGELSELKTSTLNPTWDCKPPINVNDSELWEEMKGPPVNHGKATDSIFAVVRAEMGDFVRYSPFYLEFLNPVLKNVARELPNGGSVTAMEKMISDQYFEFCDDNNPLQLMTVTAVTTQISKYHLLEGYAKYLDSSASPAEAESDRLVAQAMRMLESDTKAISSPLTKGFIWLLHLYFPFPAYIHIMHDLKKRPFTRHANQAWEVMNANYEVRLKTWEDCDAHLFVIFSNFVLQVWDTIEESMKQSGNQPAVPKIVVSLKQRLAEMAANSSRACPEQPDDSLNTLDNQTLMPLPVGFETGFGNEGMFGGMSGQTGFAVPDPSLFTEIGHPTPAADIHHINHLNWVSMVWGLREGRGW